PRATSALGGDRLRLDYSDCGGAHETEAPRFGFDACGGIKSRTLHFEQSVLTTQLVTLLLEALRLVAARRDGGGLGEIEDGQEEHRADRRRHDDERAHFPRGTGTVPPARHRVRAVRARRKLAAHRRRPDGLRGDQEIFSEMRRTALRARGLRATSAESARSGRRVTTRKPARCPQTQVGRWGGQMQSRDSRTKNCFAIRSSSEWKEMTARRPPGRSARMAASRPC